MKEGYTHISVIIDKSGSMCGTQRDTIGGFNSFISEQKEVDGEGSLTLIQFDDRYEVHENFAPLEGVKDLTSKTYAPRGSTALLDAMGKTINSTEAKIEGMSEDKKPEKVIFLVITDGYENASREFNKGQISEMVKRHEDEDEWDFVFIGANMDSISEGGSIGVRACNTLNYCATGEGTRSLYKGLSDNMTSYRCATSDSVGGKIGFFDNDSLVDDETETENEIDVSEEIE